MTLPPSRVPDLIEAPAERSAIFDLAEWAEAWAKSQNLDAGTCFAIRLCVEEAVTNIVFYAYDHLSPQGRIVVAARPTDDGALVIITDKGQMFDVSTAQDPGREGDITTDTIGGRGIRLMRNFSSKLEYQRLGDQNWLILTFVGARVQP